MDSRKAGEALIAEAASKRGLTIGLAEVATFQHDDVIQSSAAISPPRRRVRRPRKQATLTMIYGYPADKFAYSIGSLRRLGPGEGTTVNYVSYAALQGLPEWAGATGRAPY
jgi:hypothetical protein